MTKMEGQDQLKWDLLENPGNEALKKEEEIQAPRMRAEGSISHFSPCPYYSIHS